VPQFLLDLCHAPTLSQLVLTSSTLLDQ
jgi:hypothetical protein